MEKLLDTIFVKNGHLLSCVFDDVVKRVAV
jgi:hypothetical protein